MGIKKLIHTHQEKQFQESILFRAMIGSSFFIRTLLLGQIYKFSTTRYLLVEIDGVHARQPDPDLICPVYDPILYPYSGPCGWMRPVRGSPNIIMGMGRPQRCKYNGDTPLSMTECTDICRQWNRSPPPNHVGPPCAGIDFANSSSIQACELVRSLRPGGETDLLCPQFRSDFVLSTTNNWQAVINASQICRFTPDSMNNPNLPDYMCLAVFDRAVVGDTCPGIVNCPAMA